MYHRRHRHLHQYPIPKKSIVEDIEQVDCIQNQSKDIEEGTKNICFNFIKANVIFVILV